MRVENSQFCSEVLHLPVISISISNKFIPSPFIFSKLPYGYVVLLDRRLLREKGEGALRYITKL